VRLRDGAVDRITMGGGAAILVKRRKKSGPDRGDHSALFGPPPLFDGEDPKTYDQLHTEISTAVAPTDIIGEILARDVTELSFDVPRLRRLKAKLVSANAYKGLAEILAPRVGRSRAETLAEGWAANKSEDVAEVNKILTSAGLNMDTVLAQTCALKLSDIERIEHLIALAEARRNAALREMERHRQTLGQQLWRVAPQHDETRVIESTPTHGRPLAWFER
jgi:hypothetical protein